MLNLECGSVTWHWAKLFEAFIVLSNMRWLQYLFTAPSADPSCHTANDIPPTFWGGGMEGLGRGHGLRHRMNLINWSSIRLVVCYFNQVSVQMLHKWWLEMVTMNDDIGWQRKQLITKHIYVCCWVATSSLIQQQRRKSGEDAQGVKSYVRK